MKTINIMLTLLLLFVNVTAGALFESYEWWNVIASSAVLVIGLILLLLIDWLNIKTAFKVSLTILYPLFSLIEFVMALVCPAEFINNGWIVAIGLMIAFQIITLVIVDVVSNKFNS